MINKGGGFPFVGSSRLLLCLCKKKSTAHSCAVLFVLVEITGIEPVTSCMPCKRSPEPP